MVLSDCPVCIERPDTDGNSVFHYLPREHGVPCDSGRLGALRGAFFALILSNGIRGHYGRDRGIEYIFHVESRQMPGIPQSKLNVYVPNPVGIL